MRLHPAVACTMLVVGAVLILGPLAAWVYLARNLSESADKVGAPLALVSMLGAVGGVVLIVVAVLFSFSSHDVDKKDE